MEEVVWIEILSRQSTVIARHRCTGPEIRIGRGYGNDVVIDDPFVAPEHLRIARDGDGHLFAEDLGSINGVYIANGTERVQRTALDGSRPIRIGHTLIRVRRAQDPVAPERTVRAISPGYPTIAAIGAAAIGLEALTLWLNETATPRWSLYAAQLLGLVGFILAWVAAWATISRIFSNHAQFKHNLFIAVSGLLTYSVVMVLAGFLAFAFSWHAITAYEYVAVWGFVGAICFFHLREIGPTHPALKAGVVAALAGLAIAIQTVVQFSFTARGFQRPYVVQLMPPTLRLVHAKSEATFFAGVTALKDQLDRDRAEETDQE